MGLANPPLKFDNFDLEKIDTSTPVLILGGKENALSLVRRYGPLGIKTMVCGPNDCWGLYSRHCSKQFPVPRGMPSAEYFQELLLGSDKNELHGSLLIAGSDIAIEFIAQNRVALEKYYVLDHGNAEMQLKLLDKRETLIMAKKVGVATPQFWDANSEEDLELVRQSIQFPVMVKPILSHEFIKVFGCKLFIIESDFDKLAEKVRLAWENNINVMVIEMIPGPDDLLSSYYTYMDESGKSHFDYTKRIIRRYPVNRGLACYHKSEWLPETAEAGRRFFKEIGFSGLGNIEFKLDKRDNKLKVIESNARFTAAQELVIRSGAPIDVIYYCIATGQTAPTFSNYNQQLTYWYGLRDFLAFLQMQHRKDITMAQWVKSLFPLNHVSPLHNFSDPYPSLGAFGARIDKTIRDLF